MANKTFKPRAGFIGLIVAVPIIFISLFLPEFKQLLSNTTFLIGNIVGGVALLASAALTIKNKEEMSYNVLIYITAFLAVVLSIWVGSWCAQLRVDILEGIR